MKNLIRRILQESENEFGWAEEIVSDKLSLPKPSKPLYRKSYLLFPSNNSDIEMIVKELKENGWIIGRYVNVPDLEQKMIENLSSWTKEHLVARPYIYLDKNGRVSYGSGPDTFNRVYGQEEYQSSIKIYL